VYGRPWSADPDSDRRPAAFGRAVRRLTLVDLIAPRARRAGLGPVAPLPRWGFEHGTSVDRWYIEPFLDAHRAASTGLVLQMLEDLYATRRCTPCEWLLLCATTHSCKA
jgi:hypothetical protein